MMLSHVNCQGKSFLALYNSFKNEEKWMNIFLLHENPVWHKCVIYYVHFGPLVSD